MSGEHDVVDRLYLPQRVSAADFVSVHQLTLPVLESMAPYEVGLCKTHAMWWSIGNVATEKWDEVNKILASLFPSKWPWQNVIGPKSYVATIACQRCTMRRSYRVDFAHVPNETLGCHDAQIVCEDMAAAHRLKCSGRPDPVHMQTWRAM